MTHERKPLKRHVVGWLTTILLGSGCSRPSRAPDGLWLSDNERSTAALFATGRDFHPVFLDRVRSGAHFGHLAFVLREGRGISAYEGECSDWYTFRTQVDREGRHELLFDPPNATSQLFYDPASDSLRAWAKLNDTEEFFKRVDQTTLLAEAPCLRAPLRELGWLKE